MGRLALLAIVVIFAKPCASIHVAAATAALRMTGMTCRRERRREWKLDEQPEPCGWRSLPAQQIFRGQQTCRLPLADIHRRRREAASLRSWLFHPKGKCPVVKGLGGGNLLPEGLWSA